MSDKPTLITHQRNEKSISNSRSSKFKSEKQIERGEKVTNYASDFSSYPSVVPEYLKHIDISFKEFLTIQRFFFHFSNFQNIDVDGFRGIDATTWLQQTNECKNEEKAIQFCVNMTQYKLISMMVKNELLLGNGETAQTFRNDETLHVVSSIELFDLVLPVNLRKRVSEPITETDFSLFYHVNLNILLDYQGNCVVNRQTKIQSKLIMHELAVKTARTSIEVLEKQHQELLQSLPFEEENLGRSENLNYSITKIALENLSNEINAKKGEMKQYQALRKTYTAKLKSQMNLCEEINKRKYVNTQTLMSLGYSNPSIYEWNFLHSKVTSSSPRSTFAKVQQFELFFSGKNLQFRKKFDVDLVKRKVNQTKLYYWYIIVTTSENLSTYSAKEDQPTSPGTSGSENRKSDPMKQLRNNNWIDNEQLNSIKNESIPESTIIDSDSSWYHYSTSLITETKKGDQLHFPCSILYTHHHQNHNAADKEIKIRVNLYVNKVSPTYDGDKVGHVEVCGSDLAPIVESPSSLSSNPSKPTTDTRDFISTLPSISIPITPSKKGNSGCIVMHIIEPKLRLLPIGDASCHMGQAYIYTPDQTLKGTDNAPPSRNFFIQEQASESFFSYEVPFKYLSMRLNEVSEIANQLPPVTNPTKNMTKVNFLSSAKEDSIDELREKIQSSIDDCDSTVSESSELKNLLKKYESRLTKLERLFMNLKFHKTTACKAYKGSMEKSVADLEFIPTNLHAHIVDIDHALSAEIVTMGCPAAHALEFKSGGIRRQYTEILKNNYNCGDANSSRSSSKGQRYSNEYIGSVHEEDSIAGDSSTSTSNTSSSNCNTKNASDTDNVKNPILNINRNAMRLCDPIEVTQPSPFRTIIHSGWMKKKVKKQRFLKALNHKNAKPRFIILVASGLEYYHTEGIEVSKGTSNKIKSIRFENVLKIQLAKDMKTVNTIEIVTKNEIFLLSAKTFVSINEWLEKITKAFEDFLSIKSEVLNHGSSKSLGGTSSGSNMSNLQKTLHDKSTKRPHNYNNNGGESCAKISLLESWQDNFSKQGILQRINNEPVKESGRVKIKKLDDTKWITSFFRLHSTVLQLYKNFKSNDAYDTLDLQQVVDIRLITQLEIIHLTLKFHVEVGNTRGDGTHHEEHILLQFSDLSSAINSGFTPTMKLFYTLWSQSKNLAPLSEALLLCQIQNGKYKSITQTNGVTHTLRYRLDVCMSQILAGLCTSFSYRLCFASKYSPRDISVMIKLGFLISVESLLSTKYNGEDGMIEDMDAAVKELATVSFCLVPQPEGRSSQEVFFRRFQGNIEILFLIPADLWTILSQFVRSNAKKIRIRVVPLLFSQGINELQSMANKVNASELQDSINRESWDLLRQYYSQYNEFITEYNRNLNSLDIAEISCRGPSNRYNVYKTTEQRQNHMTQLTNEIVTSKLNKKNYQILLLSADLVRSMGGGRITCCKSGKDRTAMSCTLELGRTIASYCDGSSVESVRSISDIIDSDSTYCYTGLSPLIYLMRSRGVRRGILMKNTGQYRYAFSKIQRALIPNIYRAPLHTLGGGGLAK